MASLAFTIPVILISIVGFVLNIYILVVVLLTKQTTSGNNLLLLHLGIVDALLGLLFLTFSAPGLLVKSGAFSSGGGESSLNDGNGGSWLTMGVPCVLHGFLFTLLHPVALWTVCGLNCDRYYAIAAPLHYGHIVNQKKIIAGLGTGWILSFVLCLPPLFKIAPFAYNPGLGACSSDFEVKVDGAGALWYSAVYTGLTLLLPATLIICCNLKILMIARYHRHRIASAIYEVTLSAQVTITHQRNPFFVPTVTAPSAGGPKFRARSPISTVLQLLGSFLILYLPYYTSILWQSINSALKTTHNIHPTVLTLSYTLLSCSPSINGFLYGVRSKTIRKTFQNYWRKKLTKSEVNQEIQARTPSTCGSRRPSLTPLGLFSKPTIHRRLSEALLDVHKSISSPHKSNIKRIASELTWRPNSTINLSPREELHHTNTKKLVQTSSCNTLQVPNKDLINNESEMSIIDLGLNRESGGGGERPAVDFKKPMVNANILLQKFLGLDEQANKKAAAIQTVLDSTPKRSPRILITRAFSEDSDKNHSSAPTTPTKDALKKHSTSATTLLEKKWRLRYKEEDLHQADRYSKKPLLLDSSNASNQSSESSDASEASSGRLFMNLDSTIATTTENNINKEQTNNLMILKREEDEDEPGEDHLLLSAASSSWSLRKKIKEERMNFFMNNTGNNHQNHQSHHQEVVL